MNLWFPIAWSVSHPTMPVPYELWILWHFSNREALHVVPGER